jgi:hypothetical protein
MPHEENLQNRRVLAPPPLRSPLEVLFFLKTSSYDCGQSGRAIRGGAEALFGKGVRATFITMERSE